MILGFVIGLRFDFVGWTKGKTYFSCLRILGFKLQ
jgi:hypothetical protein